MKKIVVLLLTIVLVSSLAAQDRIQMLSGKEKTGYFDHESASYIYYSKKQGGPKKKVNKENVFRVLKSAGDTLYVYKQDTLAEDDYSVAQIEKHMQGQIEARKYYRPWLAAAGGFCVGGASGVLPLFYAFFPPGLYSAFVGTWSINPSRFIASDETLLSNEYFVNGYDLAAKGNKLRYAVVGSLTGLASGMRLMYMIYTYKPYVPQ